MVMLILTVRLQGRLNVIYAKLQICHCLNYMILITKRYSNSISQGFACVTAGLAGLLVFLQSTAIVSNAEVTALLESSHLAMFSCGSNYSPK